MCIIILNSWEVLIIAIMFMARFFHFCYIGFSAAVNSFPRTCISFPTSKYIFSVGGILFNDLCHIVFVYPRYMYWKDNKGKKNPHTWLEAVLFGVVQ